MVALNTKDLSSYLAKPTQDEVSQFPKLNSTTYTEDGVTYPVTYVGKRCHPDDTEQCAKEIAAIVEYLHKNNHIKAFLGPCICEVGLINERVIISYMAMDDAGIEYVKANNLSFNNGEI